MNLTWKRTLRTASSERFLALREGRDVAAVDLHYLSNGTVAGTIEAATTKPELRSIKPK